MAERGALRALLDHPWRTASGAIVTAYIAATELWSSYSDDPFLASVGSSLGWSRGDVMSVVARGALAGVLLLIVVLLIRILLLDPNPQPASRGGDRRRPLVADPAASPREQALADLADFHRAGAEIRMHLMTMGEAPDRDAVLRLKKEAMEWAFAVDIRLDDFDTYYRGMFGIEQGDKLARLSPDAVKVEAALSRSLDRLTEVIKAIATGSEELAI